MKFPPISTILVALFQTSFLFDKTNAAVFDMHLDPVGYVRTDPILDSQCLSDHVHAFYGPKALFPNTTYADLRNTDPLQVSGNIVENKSLYWHPAVYQQLSNGSFELQETKLSVYYIWDPSDPDVLAFNPGFAMIAGGSKIDPKGALNFECESTGAASTTFPTTPCNDEFFVEFKMPNCWNGQLRDAQDSHVTYSMEGTNERSDPCPSGFKKIPQLWLFIEFPNGYQGGNHAFSDGTQVLHVDYFNGWDETELKNALVNCRENAATLDPIGGTRCSQFTYKNDQLGLGVDVEYAPPQRFQTSLITDEAVTGVSQPPRRSAKNSDGTCNVNDQPKEGGTGGSSPVPSPTTSAPVALPTTSAPIVSPTTPAPVPSPTTSAPVVSPVTSAPVGTPPTTSAPIAVGVNCENLCWENFGICEANTDVICHDHIFMHDCVEDCEIIHSGCTEEIEGCIDEDCACVDEDCTADQDLCYEIEDEKCFIQRSSCLSGCQASRRIL